MAEDTTSEPQSQSSSVLTHADLQRSVWPTWTQTEKLHKHGAVEHERECEMKGLGALDAQPPTCPPRAGPRNIKRSCSFIKRHNFDQKITHTQ